jgi:hypothetical protein
MIRQTHDLENNRNNLLKMYFALLTGILLLAASCDSNTETAAKPPEIFKENLQALDKAKGVQNIMDQQAEETRKNIDEAEKGQ